MEAPRSLPFAATCQEMMSDKLVNKGVHLLLVVSHLVVPPAEMTNGENGESKSHNPFKYAAYFTLNGHLHAQKHPGINEAVDENWINIQPHMLSGTLT